MSVREILERAQEAALGLDGDAEASVWRNACEEALATLYAETVREILSGGDRTISPGGGMEQRPDWRPCLQEPSAGLREAAQEVINGTTALTPDQSCVRVSRAAWQDLRAALRAEEQSHE